jgi:beta-galactosidase GanA
MVRNNSHNWDLDADDAHKEARGLISASLGPRTGKRFAVPIRWKIQGNFGGEDIADPTRGVVNNGGLFGERDGWHLPGFADRNWETTRVPDRRAVAGTVWYRTQFDLAVPVGHDASLGLSMGDPAKLRSVGRYRVLLFVNGWNMGQFIAHIGPQRTFVIPSGILDPRGRNTLALAVTSDGKPESALERVALVDLGTVRGGVPLELVRSPTFDEIVRKN